MTMRLRKDDARQGERRDFQQRVFLISMVGAAVGLAIVLIVILALRPF